MENEERNYTLIITFEGLSDEEANKMIEAFGELEASLKEEIPEARVTIGRRMPPDGSTEVSK